MYFGQISCNIFSDITAAIYEIEELLNPPGLCIFLQGTRCRYLFCSIFKNGDARVSEAQKVKKMMFLGPLNFSKIVFSLSTGPDDSIEVL